MIKNIKPLLTLAALIMAPIIANATPVASSVTGKLLSPVTDTTTNYFDPANRMVPPGYGNLAGTVAAQHQETG